MKNSNKDKSKQRYPKHRLKEIARKRANRGLIKVKDKRREHSERREDFIDTKITNHGFIGFMFLLLIAIIASQIPLKILPNMDKCSKENKFINFILHLIFLPLMLLIRLFIFTYSLFNKQN